MADPTGEAPLVSVLGILIGDPVTVHIGQVAPIGEAHIGIMDITMASTTCTILCLDILDT